MKKNYILLFFLLISITLFAQEEVFEFNGYDGASNTLVATTADINDEITIEFEDLDIINNFYTENQSSIYIYLGLRTSSGSFQAVPGMFNDLNWQPILNISNGNAASPPNRYSITFTPGQLFPTLENQTILGIDFLFQNQFGGGGNNQSVDLYIDLVDATLNSSTLNRDEHALTKVSTSYNSGKLTITGVNTTSNIAIYNLLGRQVVDLKNIAINGTFSKYLDLPKNNIYIVKITSPNFSKTFKIVAK
ncbi:T9SS type A sorting domain-containing protein [uncultured Kordia sp.]|uniref:T9SS type A sorting domain-containing protein n=1 Tax=uncultured Kordia sp. TaxID=507699 RepID=UPI00262A878E|nr:T9SS type A sorting domain-containing protein [uncultured Kordia sp.]